MNIEEINNTIAELENGETTFVNCQKLASLYTVRDHFPRSDSGVVPTRSVLQTYDDYRDVKCQYQKHLVPAESVPTALSQVCGEIKDLMMLMYSNSDMERERGLIFECIQGLSDTFGLK